MRTPLGTIARREVLALFAVLPLLTLTGRVASAEPPRRLTAAEVASIARTDELPPTMLVPAERALLTRVAAALRAGRTEEAKQAWTDLWLALEKRQPTALPSDQTIMDWTLREAYLVPRPTLLAAADKAGFHAEKERAQLEVVRFLRSAVLGGAPTDIITVPSYTFTPTYAPNARSVLTRTVQRIPRSACPDAAINANAALKTISDDAQLANVDLQSVLQKEQQTVQILTTMSKMLHDTAMATIRKIGG